MTPSAPLAAIFLWVALALPPPVLAITCYSSNDCPSSDDTVCQVVCPEKFHFCSAFYKPLPSGGLEAILFGCLDDSLNREIPDTCSISEISTDQLGCFCNTSLCNYIGIPMNTTPSPPTSTTPMPGPGSAPVHPEKPTGLDSNTLYCRYSSNGRNVGYQVCEEDPAFLTHEAPHRGCFGSYQVEENGTLTALEQSCIDQWFGFCNFSGCRLSTQTRDTTLHTTFVYCCCNSNECNMDSPDFHPDHPIYPVQPPHEPEKHQICQFTNCTINHANPVREVHCINGFVVCSEHSVVETGLFKSNKSHHSCVSIEEPVQENGVVQYDPEGMLLLQTVFRGCHFSSTDCAGDCILDGPSDRGLYSCCCQGTLCNMNTMRPSVTTAAPSPSPSPSPSTTTGTSPPQSTPYITLIIFAVIMLVCLLLVVGMIFGFIVCFMYSRKMTQRLSDSRNGTVTATSVASSDYPLLRNDNLYTRCSLVERIGHGRFGKVWRGHCGTDVVAVKVFPHEDYSSWESEVNMYETDHLSHPHVLHYLGRDIRDDYPGRPSYWIITEYHELGSLMEYLQRETVSLREFTLMCESAASGLAHLHNGTLKPSIAHRDLKSKNILVKRNGSCCISDLGLAVKLEPGELGTHAEYQCQVGTARYMSPEVLSGAISFNREAFLRIDMYALGLICWEIAMRTDTGEAVGQMKSYQQPYEEFVGSNPGIDDMRIVVVDKHCRPELPISFCRNPQFDRIVSTIQECWDADPDARLTAQCVQGRFEEFYKAKFQSGNDSYEWSKETGYTSNASFLQDDSNKKVSTSEYASADSPSPSSINCSLRFGMSAFSPGTVPDFDSLQRSDTASTMRPGISTSSSTYASSEQVGSTTRLLLASRSPPLRSHQRVDLHETTV